MTLKFKDVCNGSKKIGYSTLRNLCPDEWMHLYLNEHFLNNEEAYFSENYRERFLEIINNGLDKWELENKETT